MMTFNYKTILIGAICSVLAVACVPKKEEKKPMEEKQIEQQKAPSKEKATIPQEQSAPTPQEMELKNEEENIEPFPG